MWVWLLVVGALIAVLSVMTLAVVGLANRRWEQQQARPEPGPRPKHRAATPDPPA